MIGDEPTRRLRLAPCDVNHWARVTDGLRFTTEGGRVESHDTITLQHR